MATRTPPNFEEHWEGANVILRTKQAGGKELHANKEELASNSPVFARMFFGDFKERNQDSVDLDFDYRSMLIILRTIHTGEDRLVGDFTAEDLVVLYRTADYFNFLSIMSMYFEKIDAYIGATAVAALELGNHDALVNYLVRMSVDELNEFMETESSQKLFCKGDARFIFEKITNRTLLKYPYAPEESFAFPEVEEEPVIPNNWVPFRETIHISTDAYRVRINAVNAENLIFSKFEPSSATLAARELGKLLENSNRSLDRMGMNSILSALRKCNYDVRAFFAPLLLYKMYIYIKDIFHPMTPTVVKFVTDRLVKQATSGCLEVAIKLGLETLVPEILAKMLPNDLRDWLLSGDSDFVYRDENGEEVTISSSSTAFLLSLDDIRVIIKTFNSKFDLRSSPPTRSRARKYNPM